MKRLATIGIFVFGMFFCAYFVGAQENKTLGRAAEVFPYPFKDLYYISPRFDRQNLKNDQYFNSYILRSIATIGGSYHFRLDVPLANSNTSGSDVFGLSDISLKFSHAVVSHNKQLYFGYSIQSVFPSATNESLGGGKWQLRPGVGFMYFRDKLAGTYSFAVEYRFSFAGSSQASNVRALAISPNVDWWFKRWYIGYYATWLYDFESNILDIPIDIEAGYSVLSGLTLSAEFIQPLLEKRSYNNEFAIKLRYTIQ